ncbi:iron chelate uptake ABC transporter family permease subunit [Priestia megaterium]
MVCIWTFSSFHHGALNFYISSRRKYGNRFRGKVQWIRLVAGVIVIILAGSSVAVAGPIGFIGLMVPHIARKLVGGDYQRILPFSALLGGILLVYADILSRFIAYPFESPVGIVTALIGAPFFLYLARKGRKIKQ